MSRRGGQSPARQPSAGLPGSPCPTRAVPLAPHLSCSGTSSGTTTPGSHPQDGPPPPRPDRTASSWGWWGAAQGTCSQPRGGGRAVPAPASGSRGKGAVPVPRMPGHRAAARSSRSRSPPGIFPAIPGQRQLRRCLRQKPQPLLLPPPLRPIRSLVEPLEPPALTAPLRRDRGQEAGASLMSFSMAKRRDQRHHPHLAAGLSALTGHLSPARAPSWRLRAAGQTGTGRAHRGCGAVGRLCRSPSGSRRAPAGSSLAPGQLCH